MKYFIKVGQKYETSHELVYEVISLTSTMLGNKIHVMVEYKNAQEPEILEFSEFYQLLIDLNSKLLEDAG